jgi:heme-degrading monooxygenase HmoA
MHARVTRLKGDPAQIDAATQSYRDALGQFAAIDGNRGAFLFVDRETGVALGITLWDDAGAMTAARDRASQLRQQAAEQVSAQIDAVEEYEVAVWEPRT